MNFAVVPVNFAVVPVNFAVVPVNFAVVPVNFAVVPVRWAAVPVNFVIVPAGILPARLLRIPGTGLENSSRHFPAVEYRAPHGPVMWRWREMHV